MAEEILIPSRLALLEAEETNAKIGNENLGFLSEQYGLLPINPPLLSLPKSHQAWDEIALMLPQLYEKMMIRKTLSELPILDASAKSLPDAYVYRAATLLAFFAHSYHWLEIKQPKSIPATIMQPWREISARLNRPRPFFSFAELVLYNWQFRNKRDSRRALDNFDLLINTVGKKEERIFYLTMTDMAAVSTPLIGAIVRAQEAIIRNDLTHLKQELFDIIKIVENITTSFLQIEPNPYSKTYCDPVTWGKCVALLPVPWEIGVKGPSGTAAPYFHLLDAFLERMTFDSMLGQDQMHYREIHNSIHIQRFIQAIEKISLRQFVAKSNDPVLKGIYFQLIETYMNENGLLGIHKRKVYGYLSSAFKAGRVITVGGAQTGSPFISREWEKVDESLEVARTERCSGVTLKHPVIHVKSITPCNKEGSKIDVKHIVFDTENTGINYEVGDRCGVLPENRDELVERTLKALDANEHVQIRLNKVWRQALTLRPNYPLVEDKILLSEFLKYAKIRPLLRSVAEALYQVSASQQLREIVAAHREDQYELWDILELISSSYDVKRLWESNPWQKENISNIVPPEQFRLYSISSLSEGYTQKELSLTVGALKYKTENNENTVIDRYGTASNFICYLTEQDIKSKKQIAVEIIKPINFQLPKDEKKPIVMFAGGTGICPFHGFIAQRLTQKDSGDNYLFFVVRSTKDFYYQEDLENWMASGKLHPYVKISGEDTDVEFKLDKTGGHFHFSKGHHGRLDAIMETEENAKLLWDLLRSEEQGGKGAYFYVCGAGLLADSVFTSLEKITTHYLKTKEAADEFLYRLVADKRYLQDIFTTFSPQATGKHGYKLYQASEIALHNTKEAGYWMIIDDEVYDISQFIYLHPGGDTIMIAHAGIDATKEYKAVNHHLDSAVNAMLSIYKIGAVKKLYFGNIWGITITKNTLEYISLEELYKNWLSYLYMVIEMENNLTVDIHFYMDNVFNHTASLEYWHKQAETVARFLQDNINFYFDPLSGENLQTVWKGAVGICAPQKSFFFIKNAISELKETTEYKDVNHRISNLMDSETPIENLNMRQLFYKVNKTCQQLLHQIKMNMLEGIKLFEEHEQDILDHAPEHLITILEKNILHIQHYVNDLNRQLNKIAVDIL